MSTRTKNACPHTAGGIAEPQASACQGGCGSTFNLRMCVTCGFVGCCESQQAHNREHFRQTGHPIIKSYPVGAGSFTWCWECSRYVTM